LSAGAGVARDPRRDSWADNMAPPLVASPGTARIAARAQRDGPARGDGAPRLLEDAAMTDALVDAY